MLSARRIGMLSVSVVLFGSGFASPAASQPSVEAFYKDKTIILEIGAASGGVLDLHGRLLSRYLSKHVPGAPSLRVQYRPGAGSKVAARYLATAAPADGTWIAGTFPSAIVDPLLEIAGLNYDPTKFQYIGSVSEEVPICMVRADAKVKSLTQLMNDELIISVTSPGGTNHDFPTVMASLIGAKFKFIKGYAGGGELNLAITKNEVQGVCGSWSFTRIQYPKILEGKDFINIFVQGSVAGDPELSAAKVPTPMGFAKTQEDREALELFLARYSFATPYMVPAGVPAERVNALRKAFIDAMSDPDLVEEARKTMADIKPTGGEDLQQRVQKIYASPKATIDRLRKAMQN